MCVGGEEGNSLCVKIQELAFSTDRKKTEKIKTY